MAAEEEPSVADQIDADPSIVGVTAAEDRKKGREIGEEARERVESAAKEFYHNRSVYAPEAETEYDAVHCDCGWAASNQGADCSREALERLGQTHATNCDEGGHVVLLDVSDGQHTETKTLGGANP